MAPVVSGSRRLPTHRRLGSRVLIAIEGVDGAGKRTLTTGLRAALEAAAVRRHPGLSALRAFGIRRPRRRGAARRPRRPGRLGARDGGAVRARPRRRRATRSRTCTPGTTSSSSTATSRPTPPTAPPGCIRASTATSSSGCATSNSTGSAPAPGLAGAARGAGRARRRAGRATAPRREADRATDAYERDDGLQRRTAEVYAALAAADWCGPWVVAGPTSTRRADLRRDLAD